MYVPRQQIPMPEIFNLFPDINDLETSKDLKCLRKKSSTMNVAFCPRNSICIGKDSNGLKSEYMNRNTYEYEYIPNIFCMRN